jgi:hypothetical protein
MQGFLGKTQGFLMGTGRMIMNGSLAAALALGTVLLASPTLTRTAAAQGAPQCTDDFVRLRDDAQKKALAVQAAGKSHVERKEMCALITHFAAAETQVVKFLVDNKTFCGIPNEAITTSKTNHAATLKFRDTVCAEGPKPKAPSLSDAIGTPTLDTKENTKTGHGTFDTLTGNPLAK